MSLSFSDAASGWAGWALAHPEFGSSVNPIPTRGGGAEYAHHITACPPGFENLAASLRYTCLYIGRVGNLFLNIYVKLRMPHQKGFHTIMRGYWLTVQKTKTNSVAK